MTNIKTININSKLFAVYIKLNINNLNNNELNTITFLDFALKIVSKNYTGKSKRDVETQIKKTLGTRKLILATSFYSVLKLLDLDVDLLSEKFFKNHKFSPLDLTPESDNRLKDFLSPYILDVKTVSNAANIENTRLSRLLSGEFTHLYPNEVYGLSKAFGLNSSQLFEYFYGNGSRPVVGV